MISHLFLGKTRRWVLPFCLLGASLVPLSFAGKIKTVVGKDVDFASYKTYQWLPPKLLSKTGVVDNDPVIVPAMKAAIDRELTARGLKEVAEGGDLQVATAALAASIPQVDAFFVGIDSTTGLAWPIAPIGRYNREGTLAINLIDSRTKKTAWAGVITEDIDNKPGGGAKKIPKAVADLFKKYPVKK